MYFATDLDNRQIKSEDGEIFTAGQLKTIVDHTAAKNEFLESLNARVRARGSFASP